MKNFWSTLLIFYPKNQRGFRKGYNSQQGLVAMIEKWKKSLNSKGAFGALLADFSMAFDSIPHEFMMAKLSSSTSSMTGLIYYLVCRKGQFLDHYYLLRLFVIYFKKMILQVTLMTIPRIVLVMIFKVQ